MTWSTRFVRMRAVLTGHKLQTILAHGLRQEHAPVWPVPLPPPLPTNEGKPTLVLDIDETLLHTYGMHAVKGDTIAFSLFFRPHLREFLSELKDLYEIVFWTAGTASYCSAMVDAMEVQLLQLPRSFYNIEEVRRDASGALSTEHVNFFALSRTQTLEENNYMKYLPMLGRPMHRVIMLDDNVRSFPLHPRNAIKIHPFLPDDRLLLDYSEALAVAEKGGKQEGGRLRELEDLGKAEIARLERDHALLDLLPLLRAAAAADDLPRELDYWRDDEYVQCDDFRETMNPLSVTRQRLLGSVLQERRETPIAPLKAHVMNHAFIEEANTAMRIHHMRGKHARL